MFQLIIVLCSKVDQIREWMKPNSRSGIGGRFSVQCGMGCSE